MAASATSGPISAERHNETRRAVKAKQRANRKKTGGFGRDGGSIIESAKRDKIRAERRAKLQAENEARLLAKLLKVKVLVLTPPELWETDMDTYKAELLRFERNVADVRRAAIEDAKGMVNRYRWETLEDGRFVINVFK